MSNLFIEHRYFNFQDKIQFFSNRPTTMVYRNIAIQKTFNVNVNVNEIFI